MNNGTKGTPNPATDPFASNLLHVQHTAASGNDGGTATSGSWQTRPLTTVQTNEIGASLSSNVLTLPAGTYILFGEAAFNVTDTAQLRIQNTTLSTTLLTGVNIDTTSAQGGIATIRGRFTLQDRQKIELQSQVGSTNAGDGFGKGNSFGTEVFADLMVWKVK